MRVRTPPRLLDIITHGEKTLAKKKTQPLKKQRSGYELAEEIPVLMTAADQQRIRDLESGVSDLLEGKHLSGLDSEVQCLREDLDHVTDILTAIAKQLNVTIPDPPLH